MTKERLTPEVVGVLKRLIAGAPASAIETPNGSTPDWQEALVEQMKAVAPVERVAWFRARCDADEDGKAIYAAVMVVEADGAISEKDERKWGKEDYRTAFRRLGWSFRISDLDDRLEVNGIPVTDVTEAEMRVELRERHIHRINVARDHMIALGAEHRYHPIKQYLESLHWDGQDYIEALAFHFRDTQGLFPLALRKWLIGCIAKCYINEQNFMLVLNSAKQGVGKSFFAKWLASKIKEFFIEGPINPDDKDALLRLIDKFIWEVSELDATTRKAEVAMLKQFITKGTVTVRVPYGHHAIEKPALASFIGTVNDVGGFLADPTGSRRFAVMNIEAVDWSYSASINPDQVWAQAYALFMRGETGQFTPEERERVNDSNAHFAIEDPIVDWLQQYFEIDPERDDWFTSTTRIIEKLRSAENLKAHTPTQEARMIASAARELGLKRTYTTRGGKTQRGYLGITEKAL